MPDDRFCRRKKKRKEWRLSLGFICSCFVAQALGVSAVWAAPGREGPTPSFGKPTPQKQLSTRLGNHRKLFTQKLQRYGQRFPVAAFSGTESQIGEKYGRRFHRQIKNNVNYYVKKLASLGMRREEALQKAALYAPVIARYTPQLFKRIQAVAKGSNCSLDEILLLNARTELLSLAHHRPQLKTRSKKAPTECTAIVLANRGQLIHAQNWDYDKQKLDNCGFILIKPTNAPRAMQFVEFGMVGKIGMNQHKISVTLNALNHTSESQVTAPGLPVHVLLAQLMRFSNLDEAVAFAKKVPRSASANIMLADGKRAVNLELAPNASATAYLEGEGSLIHTNHFKLDPKLKRRGESQGAPDTLARDRLATQLALKTRNNHNLVKRAMTILSDHSAPYPISRIAGPGIKTTGFTDASIIMDPKRNCIYAAKGPPHLSVYRRYSGAQ